MIAAHPGLATSQLRDKLCGTLLLLSNDFTYLPRERIFVVVVVVVVVIVVVVVDDDDDD